MSESISAASPATQGEADSTALSHRPKIAILLNANAKRVTPKLVSQVREIVPEGRLFHTSTFEEAAQAARQIVDEGFDTVFTGGGDGTLVGTLGELMKAIDQKKSSGGQASIPRLGILKLGTGNALASLCGASGGMKLFDDIRHAQDGRLAQSRSVRLVDTDDGILVPFAGVGLDAGILNHYVETKNALAKGAMKPVFEGAFGYFTAIVTRSVPAYFFGGKTTDVEVVAKAPAWKFGKGDVLEADPVPEGTVLYRGPTLLTSVGTTPYYGYRFTMFPLWDRMPGMMHLRIVTITARALVANLPSIWPGRYRSPLVHEYMCSDVEVRALGDKVPYQLGGDAGGYRESIRWTVSREAFELVDFSKVSPS